MMSDGRNYVGAYILPSLFPGLAITLAALGFNLLGEGIRACSTDVERRQLRGAPSPG